MLIQKECLKARSQVTAFSILKDNSIAFSTKTHGAKIFSSTECSVLQNLSIELLGHKTTAVVFSQDRELLAFANANIIYILNTSNKIILQTIRTSEGIIELLYFVKGSPYVIAGTKHGRVMQYRYDGRSQLSRLCSFGHSKSNNRGRIKNNYVSAITFHNEYIACSGYGGIITILKMNSHANKYNIEASKVRINSLCFLNEHKLISGNAEGIIQIHTLKKYHAVKNIPTPFVSIKEIIVMPNPNFIMVSGDSNKLIIIDTKNAKVVTTSYLVFSQNVHKISLNHESNLLVVLQNNQFIQVVLPNATDIKSFILHNSLDKALQLIERDPMLKGTREHKRVEVMYEKIYTQAVDALINSNIKEARKLINMFEHVESKKEDIESIFKAFRHYSRFKTLYLEKKYALVYAMAEKHPALKRTLQFKKMEETFKETFSFAQKQILLGREDVAKEILSIYATVISKKAILKLILNQNKDFIEFLQAINSKNHSIIDALVKKNEIFTQIPTFTALKNSAQESLQKIQDSINKGEVDDAIEQIKFLVDTPSVKDELQALYRDCKTVKKLQLAYSENDFILCYEIIDTYSSLDSLELTKLLEKHWAKLMNNCENFALKGDIKSIKKSLGNLLRISTRVDKIGDLIRVSFHTKIKGLLANKSFKSAENIIYSYIDIFGADSEIRLIMKSYERVANTKLAITIDQDKKVPRDNWLNSPLIMS